MTHPGGPQPSESRSSTNGGRRWLTPRLVGLVVVAVLAIVFIAQNQQNVRTRFVFFAVDAKVWVGFLVSLVLGAVLGQITTAWWRNRRAGHH